jgi:hypothetical protein
MKPMIAALALLGATAIAQAHDYLVYSIEVIRDGKTDFVSDITIENGQPDPAIFSNMATFLPQPKCEPNATVNVLPVLKGYQLELKGIIGENNRSIISMSYLYHNDKVGEWLKGGGCSYQLPIGYREAQPFNNILKLGERTELTSYSKEGTNIKTQSHQVFLTLKAIKRNVIDPIPTGFVTITQ